ncbi:MAG: LysR family transcriptional regulator [Bacilli bacterium]|nr:LysR family transcriptional regulator [Bacilli bacterium]
MNTDYNLYKIFLYLYEEKSISKTAAKLYVSQPAISYSLKELESQLGYTLFYRNSKGIEPTEEAKELYGYVSTAFSILSDAEKHLKNLDNLSIGNIKIGITSQISNSYLSEYITTFKRKYPGITFEIISKSTSEMIPMLEERNLDIIIDTLPITGKKNLTKLALSQVNNCFVYNKRINKEIKINQVEDLIKYDLILPEYGTSFYSKLEEFMESKNIKLKPLIEANTSEMILEMVRSGLGIGYLSEDVINNQNDKNDYRIVQFDDLPIVDICCVYIEEFLTTSTKKFIELLKKNN